MNRKKGKWKTSGLLEKGKTQSASTSTSVDLSLAGASVFFDGTRVDLLTTAPRLSRHQWVPTRSQSLRWLRLTHLVRFLWKCFFFPLLFICYLRADNSSNSRRSGFLPASSLNGCSDEAANLIKGVDQDSLHSKSQSEGKRRGSWLM